MPTSNHRDQADEEFLSLQDNASIPIPLQSQREENTNPLRAGVPSNQGLELTQHDDIPLQNLPKISNAFAELADAHSRIFELLQLSEMHEVTSALCNNGEILRSHQEMLHRHLLGSDHNPSGIGAPRP